MRREYKGEMNADHKPHGYGTLTDSLGEKRIGYFMFGKPVDFPVNGGGLWYKGGVNEDNNPHGYGILGELCTLEGMTHAERGRSLVERRGVSEVVVSDGDVVHGDFIDGRLNGTP